MSTQRQITDAAEDILERVQELGNPKDAVCAILIAHVKITLDHGLESLTVDEIIGKYSAAFKEAYCG